MARISVVQCDKCSSIKDVRSYEIRSNSKRIRVDLCEEDSAPLRDLLALATQVSADADKPPTHKGRVSKVTTMAEIEAMKAKKK